MQTIDDKFMHPGPDDVFNHINESSSREASVSGKPYQNDWDLGWEKLIDKIIEWRVTRGAVDDDDWINPTSFALDAVTALLRNMHQRQDVPVPDSLSSNGEGGISVEYRRGNETELIEIDSNGVPTYYHLVDSKIVSKC